MGNHEAGRTMVATATALWNVREQTNQSPQDILDIVCSPWSNCDAEFDDEINPDRPFGQIIKAAFAPNLDYDPDQDEDGELWYDKVWTPFRTTYQFG